MKKIPLIVAITFLFFLLFNSCKKNTSKPVPIKTETPDYHYLSDDIKPYLFKPGSYWVYENDSTGMLDSVAAMSSESGFYNGFPNPHGGPQNNNHYEYYKLNLKSFLTNSIYNNYLTSNAIFKNGGGEYAEEGEPIFMVNSNVGAGFYGMKIDSKLPSVTINANTFNTVDKVKITAADQRNKEFTNDTYLYFTQNMGLIKTETVLGTNNIEAWSLKRWKIIK